MTNAPYLADGARGGFRYGNVELRRRDHRRRPVVRVRRVPDGSRHRAVHRRQRSAVRHQDELAALSHERAAAAIKEGRLADEIVPVSIPQRKGEPLVVETDEGVRPGTTVESLGGLKPAFDKEGTVTAGNASQLCDGASAVVVMSKAEAERRGVTPLGRVRRRTAWSPGPTRRRCCTSRAARSTPRSKRASLSVGDVDLFEINEAFAAVGIASMADLGISVRGRQRQRRGHRPRPPDRHERQPVRAHRAPRAEAAAAAASAPSRCAAAAARATPSSCAPSPDHPRSGRPQSQSSIWSSSVPDPGTDDDQTSDRYRIQKLIW